MSVTRLIVIVTTLLMLAFIMMPASGASVTLDEGENQSTYPGNPVYYSFTVKNTNSITVLVEVVVESAWDVSISTNDFYLVFNQQSTVDIMVIPPLDCQRGQVETVAITFTETSTLDSVDTEFSFRIEIITEEEFYEAGDSSGSSLLGENEDEILNQIMVDFFVFLIILVIIFAVAIIAIKKRLLLRDVEKSWAKDIPDNVSDVLQNGRAHPRMRTVWALQKIGQAIFLIGIMWICFVVFDFALEVPIVTIVSGALLLVWIGLAPVWAYLYHQAYNFDIQDKRIVIHSGIVARRKVMIPYNRIQNVDTIAGFIQRLLGIYSIQIETAGSSRTEGSIQGLLLPEPVALYIIEKVRVAKGTAGIE